MSTLGRRGEGCPELTARRVEGYQEAHPQERTHEATLVSHAPL